jgi:hypothetical protein
VRSSPHVRNTRPATPTNASMREMVNCFTGYAR